MYNKPSFKFKKDDVFISHLKGNPKYKIHFYLNNAKINNGLDNGDLYDAGVIAVYNNKSGSNFVPAFSKDNNNPKHFFKDGLSKADWENIQPAGTLYTGSYEVITSSLEKSYVIKSGGVATLIAGVSTQETLDSLGALKNIYDHYRYLNPYFDFDTYLAQNSGVANNDGNVIPVPDYINFIEIPRLYRGNKVKEGSLVLSFYYTGSLVAEARDTNKNGLIYETVGDNVGEVIGTILYPEGLITITASYELNGSIEDGYLSPRITPTPETLSATWIDKPKWVHFMSYQSYITSSTDVQSSSYAPASSSFAIEFQGETNVPTYTMFCHADKNDLVWSNNPTYIDMENTPAGTYENIFGIVTGSKQYKESELIPIKNVVSSSFNNYSASFEPTTYISKIGVYDEDGDLIAVANLATPVKKTTKQDYTFKLKLDL